MTEAPDIRERLQVPALERREDLLDRLDVIEVLSHWKLELQARLARKQIVFLFADSDVDFGDLAAEVNDFRRVSAMLAWIRRQQP